jgi:hypothetical protein
MPDHTPEQIARAAGLGPEHPTWGVDGDGPDAYWYSPGDDCTPDRCEYIGPDYPNDPGACAQDLLPVLEQRAEHKLDISKASSWGVWIDGWLPDNKEWPTWHEAICQAVVATQPKEQLT